MSQKTEPTAEEVELYMNTLVQYIVVRKDLLKKPHKWSVGSLIGNACHASVAAVVQDVEEPQVRQYTGLEGKNGKQMHKVVLAAKDEAELLSTVADLNLNSIRHVLWTEEPEKLPTCLATKPYPRRLLQPLFKALKLFR
jgi:peptidyl-tRNA hydrolase